MLLGGGTLSSFFDAAVALEALRSTLQNKVSDLTTLKSTLQTNKSDAEQKRAELAALKQKLSNDQKGLTAARAAQTQLLQETKNKESNYQALIKEKEEEGKRFEAALYELSAGLGSSDLSGVPAARSGVLRWPLDNVFITQQFGKTSASGRLYASGTHNGVDFRAAIGTPTKASMGGVVAEINQGAVPNCQYGKWVLIKHGNNLATLYAHLSSISVTKGQTVSTGEVLGFSGNTGYATGPHLHFGVYLADAVTLKQYTCKSGKTVTIPIAPINAYLNPQAYLPG
jgi:murein DD-endopeptidase MepM/ murein hydrolase activator NlpD